MTKNGTGKSNLKVESVTAISVSDTKQTRTKPTMQKIGCAHKYIYKVLVCDSDIGYIFFADRRQIKILWTAVSRLRRRIASVLMDRVH